MPNRPPGFVAMLCNEKNSPVPSRPKRQSGAGSHRHETEVKPRTDPNLLYLLKEAGRLDLIHEVQHERVLLHRPAR